MKVQKKIDVYLVKKRNIKPIEIVQADTAIQIEFTVKDFEIPTGTTATLFVQKPSGKFVYQETGITVDGSTITIDLENQAIIEKGNLPYQVGLKNGTDEITTFEGLMFVYRSLKDSGAEESKTVIRAFDKVVQEKLNEFQTRAEQFAQAVIATIPEDYTVMEAKVNESANAIKGMLKGAIVAADDVSLVEHVMDVKIHGKNLFNVAAVSLQNVPSSATYPYVSEVGDNYFCITTLEGYTNNGYCELYKTLKELCPSLEVGKTYSLSADTESSQIIFYLLGTGEQWNFGGRKTITEKMLNGGVVAYGFHYTNEGKVGKCRISNIQVEEGTKTTEYTPYIDPATVKVRRCGKNLIPLDVFTSTPSSTTAKVANGVLTITGYLASHRIPAASLVGKTLTISCQSSRSGEKGGGLSIEFRDAANARISGLYKQNELSPTFTFTVPENTVNIVVFFYGSGSAEEIGTAEYRNVLLEVGDSITNYEAYKEATEHIPSSDGTVTGMTSLSPNMTILTDTEGMIVECEYNVDTRKFVEKYLRENGMTGGSSARIGEVRLTASGWVGASSPYSQVVHIDGVTENSQVDLTPSIEQLAVFYEKDLGFVTENVDGVVTVYAIGQKPQNDYTIQVTITEVAYD